MDREAVLSGVGVWRDQEGKAQSSADVDFDESQLHSERKSVKLIIVF